MKISSTGLDGVLLVEPQVYDDSRGFFLETWNSGRYREAGFPDVTFRQANHSRSVSGVLRGLHFQLRNPQGKLVWITRGAVFDVAVDVRSGSPDFGRWTGVELTGENHRQLWIPPGFAHGFCALTDEVDLAYLCTEAFDAASDGGICWNDADVDIAWPVAEPLLSAKDEKLPTLRKALDQRMLPEYEA